MTILREIELETSKDYKIERRTKMRFLLEILELEKVTDSRVLEEKTAIDLLEYARILSNSIDQLQDVMKVISKIIKKPLKEKKPVSGKKLNDLSIKELKATITDFEEIIISNKNMIRACNF